MADVADSIAALESFVSVLTQQLQAELDSLRLRHDVLREALSPLHGAPQHRPSLASYANHRAQWKTNLVLAHEESLRATRMETRLEEERNRMLCFHTRVRAVRRIAVDQMRQLSRLSSGTEPVDGVAAHRCLTELLDRLTLATGAQPNRLAAVSLNDAVHAASLKLRKRMQPLLHALDLRYLAQSDETSVRIERDTASVAEDENVGLAASACRTDVTLEQQTIETLLCDVASLEAARDAIQRNAQETIHQLEEQYQSHRAALLDWKRAQLDLWETGSDDEQLSERLRALHEALAAQEADRRLRFAQHPLQERLRTLREMTLVPTMSRLSFAVAERRLGFTTEARTSVSKIRSVSLLHNDVNDPVARDWMRSGDDAVLVLQDLDSGSYVAVQRAMGDVRCCPLSHVFSTDESFQLHVSFVR